MKIFYLLDSGRRSSPGSLYLIINGPTGLFITVVVSCRGHGLQYRFGYGVKTVLLKIIEVGFTITIRRTEAIERHPDTFDACHVSPKPALPLLRGGKCPYMPDVCVGKQIVYMPVEFFCRVGGSGKVTPQPLTQISLCAAGVEIETVREQVLAQGAHAK